MNKPNQFQHGFSLVSAIFLLVVLAALGVFMLSFSNTQQITSAQDVQGSRAYWAARAGLELAIASLPATCPAANTVTNMTTTIDAFRIQINTSCNPYTEAAATPNIHIFQLTSIASNAVTIGSFGFIERRLSAAIEK
jgi:MSHA biogenesis protein MshP